MRLPVFGGSKNARDERALKVLKAGVAGEDENQPVRHGPVGVGSGWRDVCFSAAMTHRVKVLIS